VIDCCECREAIGNHEDGIDRFGWPCRSKAGAAGVAQPPAEIGPAQILGAICGCAMHDQAGEARLCKRGCHGCAVEGLVHGIAGLCVRQAKGEHGIGGLAVADPAECDACIGKRAQVRPRVELNEISRRHGGHLQRVSQLQQRLACGGV